MTEQLENDSIATGGGRAKRPRRRNTKESQATIGELAVKLFTDNPAAFWSFAPELANSIDQHIQAGSSGRKRVPVLEAYLTEREREFKLRSLDELLERYRGTGPFRPDDALKALTLAAALREHAQPHKRTLLEIVERVLGISLGLEKPEKFTFLKGKPEHHTFELVRGLTLSLAWDGALISMAFDPKEFQHRQKALAFVGIATDSHQDVAKNHDAYLWTTIDER